ncbi:TRAP transporter substrate-binding protein [Rhodospirillaceae bacterium KN72]|uniref:TRAP transporter substrate-binding protein n=1 Tax=Pacificispira spongiicola TaxID=2729598 RepID=A0A7Y0HD87_9PROT|nr:TRAP transporter substrate-binding protein [Pacificispira spongiicola]NMM43551.1 TRAP transporter substrate-binding protein [Pacificispira spongiicola]
MVLKKLSLALAGISLGGLAIQANAADYDLKISTMFPSTHFIQTMALEPWAKQIEEKSEGRISITFFPAGSALGNATKQFDQVRAGVVDFAVGIPAIPRGRHPRIVLSELPFVVPNSEVGTCALMAMKDEFQSDFPDTHILNLTVTEPSGAHTNTKVATLDDLKGLRIRTPTPAITAMLEYIGATPVGMPPTEIYESVERGVIDGNIMPWGPVGAFKLWEVLKYHIDAGINPVSMYTLMNQAKYDSLPDDLKAIIDETSADVFSNWGRWWHETDQTAIEAAKANGNEIITMSQEERDAWRERLAPVVDKYLAENEDIDTAEAKALYADILKAVDNCK